MYRHCLLLAFIPGLWLISSPRARAAEPESVLADEMVLKSAGIATDSASLLEFFRNRNRPDASAKQIAELIDRLQSEKRAIREKAAVDLIILGPATLPALRAVASDPDAAEPAALARRCLKTIPENGTEITAAAARLLLQRKPTGSAEVLLGFLPRSENENVLQEIKEALSNVAYPDGKPDPTLLKALSDDSPMLRATAIEVLCSNGLAEPRATLRKLLDDPVPTVRYRAAMALAQTNDAKAIGTLIALLADLQVEDARQVEDVLYMLAGEKAPKVQPGEDAAARAKCRDAWNAWWVAADGANLLDEFKKRTLSDGDREKCLGNISLLSDDAFKVREKATDVLKGMGVSIVPLLRQAANDEDPEVGRRVRECLELLDKDKSATLPSNLPRLVAVRKPAGSVEALLGFVPSAEDDFVREEVQIALNAVAYVDGKPDPALAKALGDKSIYRRAAAAVALCQGSLGDNLPAVRKLLEDKDPLVRMQAALSLAGARQKDAVPVLIALVQELPEGKARLVEEYLLRVAGDKKPAGLVDGDANRSKRREVWAAWWKDNAETVALVDRNPPMLAQRYLGYTLLVQSSNNQISELGADGKVRWTIAGVQNPMAAQMLPGERVLICESGAQMITERNTRGDILWKVQVPNWPISASRLPNGNTLVVCRNQLLEVDRSGKQVVSINRPMNDIMNAVKNKAGEFVCVSSMGTVVTLDATGKEGKTYHVGQIFTNTNDILPNGNTILPQAWMNKLVEYDTTGKVVWDVNIQQPMSATRLPNGNTLVTTQQPWPGKLYELDRKGQVVKETAMQFYAQKAYRR